MQQCLRECGLPGRVFVLQVIVQQARQLGQDFGVARCLKFQLVPQALRAHLFEHPLFQEGLGRAPQIQIGVKLAAQPFDVEQRFLQQHQLRLNFHLKAARGLEQAHQHHAQRNLGQRAIKVGLADAANRCFQCLDAGGGRHPAAFNVQLGHALVVAAEKRREVLRQILFVELGERAHDAKVQRDVAAKGLGGQADHDVARVHVGVEKTVAKHLGEENRHPIARQLGNIDPGFAQRLHLADGHAVHALHHHHVGVAEVPENLGHQQQVQPFHVAAQLRGIGGLAHQVQLIVEVGVELGHHFARLEALAVAGELFHPTGHHVHERQVFVDDALHAWAHHLDGHLALVAFAVADGGKVHLRNRGAGHGLALEGEKNFAERFAKRFFNRLDRNLRIEGRHAVLQLGQLLCHIGRQQVAARGQHLTKFDKNRPQLLQRLAQALPARSVQAAAQGQDTAQDTQPRVAKAGEHQLVQPITQHHPEDGPRAKETAHNDRARFLSQLLGAACAAAHKLAYGLGGGARQVGQGVCGYVADHAC